VKNPSAVADLLPFFVENAASLIWDKIAKYIQGFWGRQILDNYLLACIFTKDYGMHLVISWKTLLGKLH